MTTWKMNYIKMVQRIVIIVISSVWTLKEKFAMLPVDELGHETSILDLLLRS